MIIDTQQSSIKNAQEGFYYLPFLWPSENNYTTFKQQQQKTQTMGHHLVEQIYQPLEAWNTRLWSELWS